MTLRHSQISRKEVQRTLNKYAEALNDSAQECNGLGFNDHKLRTKKYSKDEAGRMLDPFRTAYALPTHVPALVLEELRISPANLYVVFEDHDYYENHADPRPEGTGDEVVVVMVSHKDATIFWMGHAVTVKRKQKSRQITSAVA